MMKGEWEDKAVRSKRKKEEEWRRIETKFNSSLWEMQHIKQVISENNKTGHPGAENNTH